MEGELKENINEFLKYNAIWIAVAVVILIVLIAILLLIFNRIKKDKKVDNAISSTSDDEWIEALGGTNNILEASSKGSRLTITLKVNSKINDEKLKQLGVQSILKMSNKIILVVEKQADVLLNKINKK